MKKTIIFNGKEFKTSIYGNSTKEERDLVKQNYFKKPDLSMTVKQLTKIMYGGSKNNLMWNRYFDEIASKTLISHSKFTIKEMLDSEDLLDHIISKSKTNDKVFNQDLISNVKTCVRLGGKGMASKPTQFPPKVLFDILKDYNMQGKKFFDPCAGWGMRALVSQGFDMEYIGCDTNKDVVEQINNMKLDLFKEGILTNITVQNADCRDYKLTNSFDFSFTSPPYFMLEQYNGMEIEDNYETWVEVFLKPMLEVMYENTKQDGIIAINIKDMKNMPMLQESNKKLLSLGCVFLESRTLKNNKRMKSTGEISNQDEQILIFRKA